MKYFILCLFSLGVWLACGKSKQKTHYNKPIRDCAPGESREQKCAAGEGEILEVCNEKGKWYEAVNSCEVVGPPPPVTCNETTYEDIKPIFTDRCVRCHSGYDQYNIIQRKWDQFDYRINLPPNDQRAMPPGTNLSPGDKAKLNKFKRDGLLQECASTAVTPFGGLTELERAIVADLTRLQPNQRLQARYLITEDARTLQLAEAEWGAGVQKQLNSLSLESNILRVEPINEKSTIYRFLLDDFGHDRADWDKIEAEDKINFESFTSEGELIKFLTQTAKPWLHASNYSFITNKANIYYDLLGIPDNTNDFLKLNFIDADLVEQIEDFDARLVGFNGSPITIQKNRLVARYESQEGYLWITYDIFDTNEAENNLFNFPLLGVGEARYKFDASELIFSLPNGLQGYALFNANGGREDFAPTNLVFDTESKLDPQIDNALDCHRCHKAGLLPNTDEIKSHVRRNAGQFTVGDVQLVQFLYTENSGALFQKDNNAYAKVLEEVGTDPARDDINGMVDHLRTNYGLAKLAAFLFVTPEQLNACLAQSAVLQAEIGQLLTEGEVTLEQLETTLPVLLKDCGFNQELFYP